MDQQTVSLICFSVALFILHPMRPLYIIYIIIFVSTTGDVLFRCWVRVGTILGNANAFGAFLYVHT